MSLAQRAVAHVAALAYGPPYDPAYPITIAFHPDRLVSGIPILRAMATSGAYLSQFVTGVSNGGLGGDRPCWESRIFGGVYDAADPVDRPIYGAVDHLRDGRGGASRFGSAHFRLRPEVLDRVTFCHPDSYFQPESFGTAASMGLLALLGGADLLDDYVEAHIHGGVRFDRDVEALVLDPCYRGTEIEDHARELGRPVEWHTGFRLSVDELRRHPDYRGPEHVALGESLARDGHLDPAVLGEAARAGHDVKRLWHCLARYGWSPPTV